MKLVFMWIDKYRYIKDNYLLNDLNINFHHKYRFKFDGKDKLSFEIVEDSCYIDSYYPKNQYYNLIVGKNGSGKSSVLELLYNGVSIVNDFSNYKEINHGDSTIKQYKMRVDRKFFVIFYDEYKEYFLFWGAKIENNSSVSLQNLNETNFIDVPIELDDFPNEFEEPYFNSNLINFSIIGINSDFGDIVDIQEKPIVASRIKISDNIHRKKYIDTVVKKNFDFWKKYDLPMEESKIYEEMLIYEQSDFVKYFLYNINEYKHFQNISKDIEIPEYFFVDFKFIDKSYYEKQFDKLIKNNPNIKQIKDNLLTYYDLIVENRNKLTLLQKIKLFFVFYLCEQYLFYSSMPDVFLQSIDFSNFKNINIENIDSFIQQFYTEYLQKEHIIEIGGQKGNFKIAEVDFFNKITSFFENNIDKAIDNKLIFKIDSCNNNELIDFVSYYIETFRIGIPFLTFSLFPILSSGHLQLFKIFNYIIESIKKLKEKNNHNNDILLLIDEPDVNLHYEWQRNFIGWLSDFLTQFEDINFHIIITSHSAFMLSDIPKENIITLNRQNNKTILKQIDKQTLAQNIFENLNNDFFIDQFIGGYIEKKILNILKKDSLENDEKELIKSLGEKILRESLKMKLEVNG